MGLLSTLLHEASTRRPAEVFIETDRPVRMRLADGSSAELAATIEGTAISDELSDLLTTEQQVDLALGEPVKFDLVVGLYTWRLVGETAREVVSVRACPTGELLDASDSVQIPIEPDEPDTFDDDLREQDIPRIRRASSSGPSEIDIDISFDDPEPPPDDRPATGLRLAALKPVPADSKPQPMWPRRVARSAGSDRSARSTATRAGMGPRLAVPGPRVVAPPPRAVENSEGWSQDARRGPRPVANTGPRPIVAANPGTSANPGTAANPGTSANPGRQLPLRPARRGALSAMPEMAELLAAFEPGSLALLLRAAGQADALAAALGLPALTLGDADTQAQASARLGELGTDGVIIVRAEDPSPWLGWLLRRVEEGRRVIVETEARTPAGARRVLLGVGATPRAELWLDEVRVLSATVTNDRWALLSPGN